MTGEETCEACHSAVHVGNFGKQGWLCVDCAAAILLGTKTELAQVQTAYEALLSKAVKNEATSAAYRALCIEAKKAADDRNGLAGYSDAWNARLVQLLAENTEEGKGP